MSGPAPGLAIVAGRGALPRLLAEDCARRGRIYGVVVFDGQVPDWAGAHPNIVARFEKPGRMFDDMRAAGLLQVVMAGGIARPQVNPLQFDLTGLRVLPRILAGLGRGDNDTLSLITRMFEDAGFAVVAAHDILSGLLAPGGVLTRAQPSEADSADAGRAADIVRALGAVDVGQGAVVAQGLCLGAESIQGTDAMLAFVARTSAACRPDPQGARGVLLKAPKPGQDWRVDLPAIGPDTITHAHAAGLAGVVVQAGGVLVLGLDETIARADALGLFLWGRPE